MLFCCQHVDFPECKLTMAGEEYRGHVAVTRSGQSCRKWEELPEDENYCRGNPHPSASPQAPWCYVEGGEEGDWEECNIPLCKREYITLHPHIFH